MKKYFCDFQVWCIRIIWSPYTYTYIQKRTYPISQGFLLVLLMCTWTFYLSLYMSKQKHYFANKGLSSQGYGFSSGHVWLWELDWEESRAPKNWCFWTVVLDKTESPLDCKEIILKEISPGVHWKDWCHLMQRVVSLKRPWCWEGLGAGGEGEDRGWDGIWMPSLTWWTDMSLSKLWELVMDREAWRAVIHGVTKSQTRLSNWTELNFILSTLRFEKRAHINSPFSLDSLWY